MIDAVLSLHTNPATCGVAKFSARLARELGVPFESLDGIWTKRRPLVSLKFSEATDMGREFSDGAPPYELFLHDWDDWREPMVRQAERVYAANAVIARQARRVHRDVVEAWCPSTIEGNPTRGAINVLTFGMAHKIQTTRYDKLKALLDATGDDYTVSVSTAIHEGSPWDETALVAERLRAIYGSRLRVLGYLADDALARELRDCTAVALFFDPALRANNTTFWAAVEANKLIITNLDEQSPTPFWTSSSYYDIDTMTEWPSGWFHREYVGANRPPQTWAALVKTMRAEQSCAK